MQDKRKAPRLQEDNEVTITVVSGGKNIPKGKVIYNYSKDISSSGARIKANLFLPVDTLLKLDLTLKKPTQVITTIGKVKWIKIIYGDESYEAGVEFVNTPTEAIQKLQNYIASKQRVKSFLNP
jgi:hypothetical protein